METGDIWRFRIKSSLILTGISLVVIVTNTGSIVDSFAEVVFFSSYLAVGLSIRYDIRHVRKTTSWMPNPWLWTGTTLLLGCLPALVYLSFRRICIGTGETLPLAGFANDDSGTTDRTGELYTDGGTIPEAADKWGFRLKWALLVSLVSFGVSSTSSSGGAGIAGVLFAGSYLAAVVSVWRDARAINETGEWAPRPWLWALGTLVFYLVPAAVYLGVRYRHVGDLGRPMIGGLSVATGGSDPDSETVEAHEPAAARNGRKTGERHRDSTLNDTLERGDTSLDRGAELLDQREYLDARDEFKDARDAYESAEAMAESSPSLSVPRVAHRIDRADRGIESCWILALKDRLDNAESALEGGDIDQAKSSFEQVRAVLDGRTFEYYDIGDIERRLRRGHEECLERRDRR